MEREGGSEDGEERLRDEESKGGREIFKEGERGGIVGGEREKWEKERESN